MESPYIHFALHSSQIEDVEDHNVDAAVFAKKLGLLAQALSDADKAVNKGEARHRYVIQSLHTSTPTAVLAERPIERSAFPAASGIGGFYDCANSLTLGDVSVVEQYGRCAQRIGQLAKGAGQKFGYAEITANENAVRVDPFLEEQAKALLNPNRRKPAVDAERRWFKGAAEGSFVGKVQVADLRGKLPAIKLILSAGGHPLDCICEGIGIEEIKEALNRRVRISGRAIYDGRIGLPRRVMIRSIEPADGGADISQWRGAFRPFAPDDWEMDTH